MHLILRYIALSTLIGTLLIVPTVVSAATETEDLPRGHSKFTTIVTKKAGALTARRISSMRTWLGVTGRSRSKRGMK